MSKKLRIFGHTAIRSQEVYSAPANVANLSKLLQVFPIDLLQFMFLKNPFNLVYLFVNVLFLEPLFLELCDNLGGGKIYDDSVADYLAKVIK